MMLIIKIICIYLRVGLLLENLFAIWCVVFEHESEFWDMLLDWNASDAASVKLLLLIIVAMLWPLILVGVIAELSD